MTMQQPTQLIVTETDSCDFLEVSRQSFGGPRRESVTQILRIGSYGFFHSRDVFGGCPTRSSRRFLRLECFEPAGNGVIPVFELAKLEREVLHEKATQALRRG